uniref:Uncharacterized protein n=1 Tax=Globisporangium ultimum (strain ATCC 200006 / CBS 805.95 / DAOM BR144) TaxID=431595 RepID=K3W602_GLOUD
MAEGVWQSAAFVGLFGDPYLRNTPYEAGGNPQALMGTLDVFAQVLHPRSAFVPTAGQEDPVAFLLSSAQEQFVLQSLIPQLQQCKEWTEKAMKIADAKQLQAFLKEWKAQLLNLKIGEPMMIPGGYIGNISSHTIIYIVEKISDDEYTFTVCNKGPGAEIWN